MGVPCTKKDDIYPYRYTETHKARADAWELRKIEMEKEFEMQAVARWLE